MDMAQGPPLPITFVFLPQRIHADASVLSPHVFFDAITLVLSQRSETACCAVSVKCQHRRLILTVGPYRT